MNFFCIHAKIGWLTIEKAFGSQIKGLYSAVRNPNRAEEGVCLFYLCSLYG